MSIWVLKNRLHLKDGRLGWHSDEYFDGYDFSPTEPYLASEITRSRHCQKFIRAEVQKDDGLVFYQVDERAIRGFSEADSEGMESVPGISGYDSFYWKPASQSIKLTRPLPIAYLRRRGCSPRCFGPGTQGTLFSMTEKELAGVMAACCELNPLQAKELQAWLTRLLSPSTTPAG